jgi:hypothetical protein
MANTDTIKEEINAERVCMPDGAPIIPGMSILPAVNPKKSPTKAIIHGIINPP